MAMKCVFVYILKSYELIKTRIASYFVKISVGKGIFCTDSLFWVHLKQFE